jgi:ATP-binding cassette, subfamily B, bacterial MsbA
MSINASARQQIKAQSGILLNQKVQDIIKNDPGWANYFKSASFDVFFKYLKPHTVTLMFLVTMGFLSASFTGAESVFFIVLMKSFLDTGTAPLESFEIGGLTLPVIDVFNNPLLSTFVIYLGLVIISATSKYIAMVTGYRLQIKFLIRIRNDILKKILGKDVGYFSDNRVSELTAIMESVVARFSSILTSIQEIFTLMITVSITLFLLLKINVFLTLILVFVFSMISIFQGYFRKRGVYGSYDFEVKTRRFFDEYLNLLYGIRLVKQTGREPEAHQRVATQIESRENQGYFLSLYKAQAIAVMDLLNTLGLVLFFGAIRYFKGYGSDLGASGLIGYGYLAYTFGKNMKSFAGLRANLSVMSPYFTIMSEFLTNNQGDEAPHPKNKAKEIKGEPDFKISNLAFSHGESEFLKVNDLVIKPGTAVALVGFSGSGKSTLLDLMARIRLPKQGSVLFRGSPLQDYSKQDFYSKVGYASQEIVLFNDTIRENVCFLRSNVSDEAIWNALDLAKASDFVRNTEDGLNTIIGERGTKTSGGERQRLNLARVLLGNPEILFLDEATNALDLMTESQVYDALLALRPNKTVIVAAHRLSTIRNFDQIIVMSKGKIVQTGIHDDLIQKEGLYKTLYELQKYD